MSRTNDARRLRHSQLKSRFVEQPYPTRLLWGPRYGENLHWRYDPRFLIVVAIEHSQTTLQVPEYLVQVTEGHGTTMYHAKVKGIKPISVVGNLPDWGTIGSAEDFIHETDIFGNPKDKFISYRGGGTNRCIVTKAEIHPGFTDGRRYYFEAEAVGTKFLNGRWQIRVRYYSYQESLPRDASDPHDWIFHERPVGLKPQWDYWHNATETIYAYSENAQSLRQITNNWLFWEPEWFQANGHAKGEYFLNAMRAAARDALDEFPFKADNNISNLKDAFGAAFSILTGNVPGLLETLLSLRSAQGGEYIELLRELWLMWRYGVTTTASDTKQALDALQRSMLTYYTPLRFNGMTSSTIQDTNFTVRVCFDARLTTDPIAEMRYRFRDVGLDVSAYTVWDLIPFSFMVDWFVPVGDRFEDERNNELLSSFIIENVCWSVSYVREHELGSGEYYTRWYEPLPDLIYGDCVHLPSGKAATWGRRALDVFAIAY